MPIQLLMPTIGVNASVLGVGMTVNNVMDAPMGKADNPDWQQAFWYRGSAVPGAASSAVIAAHVSDPLGRAGPFARLVDLHAGDPIIVHDSRNGLDVRFEVTDATSYPLAATSGSGRPDRDLRRGTGRRPLGRALCRRRFLPDPRHV